jgi:hypothetical protein
MGGGANSSLWGGHKAPNYGSTAAAAATTTTTTLGRSSSPTHKSVTRSRRQLCAPAGGHSTPYSDASFHPQGRLLRAPSSVITTLPSSSVNGYNFSALVNPYSFSIFSHCLTISGSFVRPHTIPTPRVGYQQLHKQPSSSFYGAFPRSIHSFHLRLDLFSLATLRIFGLYGYKLRSPLTPIVSFGGALSANLPRSP